MFKKRDPAWHAGWGLVLWSTVGWSWGFWMWTRICRRSVPILTSSKKLVPAIEWLGAFLNFVSSPPWGGIGWLSWNMVLSPLSGRWWMCRCTKSVSRGVWWTLDQLDILLSCAENCCFELLLGFSEFFVRVSLSGFLRSLILTEVPAVVKG